MSEYEDDFRDETDGTARLSNIPGAKNVASMSEEAIDSVVTDIVSTPSLLETMTVIARRRLLLRVHGIKEHYKKQVETALGTLARMSAPSTADRFEDLVQSSIDETDQYYRVQVRFRKDNRSHSSAGYTYYSPVPCLEGDKCVVDSPYGGYVVVDVIDCEKAGVSAPMHDTIKFIVQRIDDAWYRRETTAKDKQRTLIEMDRRRKVLVKQLEELDRKYAEFD